MRELPAREFTVLVDKARKGDGSAFEEIIRLNSRDIFFYMQSMLGNKHDAEDAAQEAIIQMWRSIGQLKSSAAFTAWMYKVLRSKALRAISTRGKYEHEDLDGENLITGEAIIENSDDFIPERYAENSELSRELYDIVLGLPEKRREVVLMHYYADLTIGEIAEMMSKEENTIRSMLSKARGNIKAKLTTTPAIFAAIALPSHTVLGKALQVSADAMTPVDIQNIFGHAAKAAIAAAPAVAISAKKLVGVALACFLSVSTVVGSAVYLNIYINQNKSPAAPPLKTEQSVAVTSSAPRSNGEIVMKGDCECGHLNPDEVRLKGCSASNDRITYDIKDNNGNVILTGKGNNAAQSVNEMKRSAFKGDYFIYFNVYFEDGHTAKIYRNFELST